MFKTCLWMFMWVHINVMFRFMFRVIGMSKMATGCWISFFKPTLITKKKVFNSCKGFLMSVPSNGKCYPANYTLSQSDVSHWRWFLEYFQLLRSLIFVNRNKAHFRMGHWSIWTHAHHGIPSASNGFPFHVDPADSLSSQKTSCEGEKSRIHVEAKLGFVWDLFCISHLCRMILHDELTFYVLDIDNDLISPNSDTTW